MKSFLVITNIDKDGDFAVTKEIANYIEKSGRQVVLSRVNTLREDIENSDIIKGIDCAIVLGGDGTITRTANDLMMSGIPILGVNLGTLGFLAEIERQNVSAALEHLFIEDYKIENRLMLRGEVLYNDNIDGKNPGASGYALNDIVISRKGVSRIISLGIYLNDELVDNFRGDGVIISTPTGSTAYNLSAGGPIVSPKADIMVITPICPHSLSPRSIVVSADDTVHVVVRRSRKTQEEEATASFDGQKTVDMGTDDVILINKASYNTKLIKLSNSGLFEVLRSKLSNRVD